MDTEEEKNEMWKEEHKERKIVDEKRIRNCKNDREDDQNYEEFKK